MNGGTVRRWREFGRRLWREWQENDVGTVAGAVTFFGVLAIFPFLLFVVSLAAMVIDPGAAENLVARLENVAPPEVAAILAGRVRSLAAGDSPALLTASALGAVWAASNGVGALMKALNAVYDVEERRSFVKRRAIAIATTLAAALLSILAMLAAVAAPAAANLLPGPAGVVLRWLGYSVGIGVMAVVLALLYWALPATGHAFRLVTPGSVVASLLWLGASIGFSIYVRNFGNFDATYGALGGIIVFLTWMWISSQVILLGAELNSILMRRRTP